jgi:hypothetical protein
MDLLTAVNRILPKLGEHPVTSLTSKSPTLAIILTMFEDKVKEAVMQGWWFNTHRATLPIGPEGEITLSPDTLSFVADLYECSIRKRQLHNSADNTFVWAEPVAGILISYVPFDELPESVASLVYYTVLVEACVTDIGMTDEVRAWQAEIGAAGRRALSEHLKNKKYSTQSSRRYQRIRRAMRG